MLVIPLAYRSSVMAKGRKVERMAGDLPQNLEENSYTRAWRNFVGDVLRPIDRFVVSDDELRSGLGSRFGHAVASGNEHDMLLHLIKAGRINDAPRIDKGIAKLVAAGHTPEQAGKFVYAEHEKAIAKDMTREQLLSAADPGLGLAGHAPISGALGQVHSLLGNNIAAYTAAGTGLALGGVAAYNASTGPAPESTPRS